MTRVETCRCVCKPNEVVLAIQKAFQLNPFPPSFYFWLLGWAQYSARRYEDAVRTLRHQSAGGTGSQRILAGALAQLGRLDEAHEEARHFLAALPSSPFATG